LAFLARFASANQPPGLKTGSDDRPAEKAFTLKARAAAKANLLPQFDQKASEKMEPSKTAWLPVISRLHHFAIALIKMHSTTS